MQNIMIDVALLQDAGSRLETAPARAIAGWLYLQANATITKNGGVFPKDTGERWWAKVMPENATIADVIAAGLVEDDGRGNWELWGYHVKAEAAHTGKQRGGSKGAAVRWSKNGIPNGIPNGNATVRTDARTHDSTPARTAGGTHDSTPARQLAVGNGVETEGEDDYPKGW